MKTMILAFTASLGLLAGPAMADTNWNGTGPNGGTATGSANCTYANGVTTCQGASTYTNPKGKVFQRESTATGNRFGGQRVITTTGPNGQTGTATRSWVRD